MISNIFLSLFFFCSFVVGLFFVNTFVWLMFKSKIISSIALLLYVLIFGLGIFTKILDIWGITVVDIFGKALI